MKKNEINIGIPTQLYFGGLEPQGASVYKVENSTNDKNTFEVTTNETSVNNGTDDSCCSASQIDNCDIDNNISANTNHSKKQFSSFKAPITNKKPDAIYSLNDAYKYITSEEAKKITEEYRKMILNGITDSSKEYKRTHFVFCTFSGIFWERSEKGLIEHSGLLCFDFDHVPNLDLLRTQLLQDEYFDTALLFRSPSGDGLKWVIRFDSSEHSHKSFFIAVSNYLKSKYDAEVDKSGKDVCRACFLPYDPDCYFNDVPKTPTKEFNPDDWKEEKKSTSITSNLNNRQLTTFHYPASTKNIWQEIEELTKRVELVSVDIAPTYEDWRNMGFALVDALGEGGRIYYHRLSCLHSDYSEKETNKQYNNCLNSKGVGIKIGTLFGLAQKAGIDINRISSKSPISSFSSTTHISSEKTQSPIDSICDDDITNTHQIVDNKDRNKEDFGEMEKLPTFSNKIRHLLPEILLPIVDNESSPVKADLLLLGTLTFFSALMPNVYHKYGTHILYANLYLYVTAPPASDKGILNHCKHIYDHFQKQFEEEYNAEMAQYKRDYAKYKENKNSSDEPIKPQKKMILIPGNSSSTSLFQILDENNGCGLLFETESDTITIAFKKDYGNYSDGLRNAYHHESIGYTRRTNNERVYVDNPRLSILLSGTPNQVISLIPESENGLLSRFLFYYIKNRAKWRRRSERDKGVGDNYFHELGKKWYSLYEKLNKSTPIQFEISESQDEKYDDFYELVYNNCPSIFGVNAEDAIARLGVATRRMAMILSTIRLIGKELPPCINCEDADMESAMIIGQVLLQHIIRVYASMPNNYSFLNKTSLKKTFFNSLPSQFDRKTYVAIAKQLGIPEGTAEKDIDKMVKSGLLLRVSHGHYSKPA